MDKGNDKKILANNFGLIGHWNGRKIDAVVLDCTLFYCRVRRIQNSKVIISEMSIIGTHIKEDELANILQVCLDSGVKRVLMPITDAGDLGTVPAELVGTLT